MNPCHLNGTGQMFAYISMELDDGTDGRDKAQLLLSIRGLNGKLDVVIGLLLSMEAMKHAGDALYERLPTTFDITCSGTSSSV
jgi:hypothetical protein